MICPFRCGVKYDYMFIGVEGTNDEHNPQKFLETAQHSLYEDCVKEECPYYYGELNGCTRVNE